MYQQIKTIKAAGILTVLLNRPEKLNAFSEVMMREMVSAFDDADADDDIRVVVVTGEGRAFCAGADLSAGPASFKSGVDHDRSGDPADYADPSVRDVGGLLTLRIYRSLKPVIAAINGAAVGVGATMTLPMDIRLIAAGARIGFVFARRGIVPEAASTFFLPRVVGISRAMEWCATGRLISAEAALAAGLARSLHAPEDLLPAAYAIAREIADNTAPVSVALTRQMLWRSFAQHHPMEAHRLDSRAIHSRGRAADAAEGVSSFLEKRAPHYPNTVSHDMPDFYPWWDEPDYY